jgi:fatty-acyl-CoA synthase
VGHELDWLEGRARLYPNKIAVIDANTKKSWTFQQMNNRARVLANFLQQQGIKKGDRIALLSPNDISCLDFLFASIKLGSIFVPLNWRLTKDELNYILMDASPKFVGIHQQFLNTSEWIKDQFPCIEIHHDDYMESFKEENKYFQQELDIDQSTPLAMIYTGGTTGKPKGAILSHRSILWNGFNTILSWNITESDITLTSLPMFHTGGINALTVPVLLAGGTVIVSSDFKPEEAVQYIEEYGCTIILFVPTMHHMVTQTEAFQIADFSKVKVFLSGGAPCPLTVYEAYERKGVQFKEGYGLTEAGPNNFYIHPDEAKIKRGSIGRAMIFNEIKIVNEKGQEVKANEVGELLLKGNHLFEYYWNKEMETKDALKDGWLYTGDLARRDEDGYVYIVGRKKEMIITGGENVYPLEIEQWLNSHEGVNEVCVVGIPHEKWGEVVTAFVSFYDGYQIEEEELKAYCSQKLARYKIPKRIIQIKEIPKTPVGKIDKKALIEQYSNIYV